MMTTARSETAFPDVNGIGDDRHPILHRVGRDAADQSANQYNQRHAVLVKANRFGKPSTGNGL